jgi:hypothetical protein
MGDTGEIISNQKSNNKKFYILTVCAFFMLCLPIVFFSLDVDNPFRKQVIGEFSYIFKPDFKTYIKRGNKIVKALEDYKATNGKYPDSLKELKGVNIKTVYGRWRIKNYGEHFYLIMGDYGINLWELIYYSHKDEWNTDT